MRCSPQQFVDREGVVQLEAQIVDRMEEGLLAMDARDDEEDGEESATEWEAASDEEEGGQEEWEGRGQRRRQRHGAWRADRAQAQRDLWRALRAVHVYS